MSDASNAKLILDNPLFNKLLRELKIGLYEEWEMSKDKEERENIFRRQEALGELFNELNSRLVSETDARSESSTK